MAIVTRYFSTSSAGAADGTTWADRATLLTSTAFSTIITGFAFNGSDSLRCLIGPGTNTPSTSLSGGSFANPPTVANPLEFHGCDSSGVVLEIANPGWTSDQPVWDDSGFPVIACTANQTIISNVFIVCRLIKFTHTGATNRAAWIAVRADWCTFYTSTSDNTSSFSSNMLLTNSVFDVANTTYASATDYSVNGGMLFNVRIKGVAGSSGTRHGIVTSGTSNNIDVSHIDRCTVVGFGGSGFADTTTTTPSRNVFITKCNFIGNGGAGILMSATASQIRMRMIANCYLANNTAWGIDNASSRTTMFNNRLRDNTSGNITGAGNHSTDRNNYTTDSDDATEFVDAGTGDYRIKSGSVIHGNGYGVSDQASSGGGGGPLIGPGRLIRG